VVVGEGGVEKFIEINGEEGEMGMQGDVKMQGWREQHGGMGMGRKMEVQTSSFNGTSNHMAWPSDGTR
jgi:hypothetical protein